MKLLVVSQRIHECSELGERRDTLDWRFTIFHTCGYMIAPIPNLSLVDPNNDFLTHFLDKLGPDGIVISGGDDINVYVEET